jgi:hypothetical protein
MTRPNEGFVMSIATKKRIPAAALIGATVALFAVVTAPGASAQGSSHGSSHGGLPGNLRCAPAAFALSFSDSLDKLVHDGAELGGLSSLAYDARSHAWVSAVDNNGTDPARIWFFRDLRHPEVVRDPLVLTMPDGTPYNGMNADDEGLAVLPDGDFVVSSETEPSIRVFDRAGVQQQSLPVPARFAVTGTTPAGQATSNATLEGLTITPNGREIVATMEGALSGDVAASGDASLHRFLVYDVDRHGHWQLSKQIAYRTEAGNRVPEVAAYTDNSILVEEAAFTVDAGNSVELYAVPGINRAKDVSRVTDLATAPARDVVAKKLVANLVTCPTLGAKAKETQTNPLLDNFEGMAITGRSHGLTGVSMISDDNFSATQTTRVLNLAVRLP